MVAHAAQPVLVLHPVMLHQLSALTPATTVLQVHLVVTVQSAASALSKTAKSVAAVKALTARASALRVTIHAALLQASKAKHHAQAANPVSLANSANRASHVHRVNHVNPMVATATTALMTSHRAPMRIWVHKLAHRCRVAPVATPAVNLTLPVPAWI